MFPASNAYDYPLLIKHILTNATRAHARQEIVSHAKTRLSYEAFERRVHQLAHSLNNCGIDEGMRVGVMDWDTNRYLECFFAVPMMGATLFTINVRLSPAQVP